MATMDRINSRMGRRTVFFAGAGTARPWRRLRAERVSPRYTHPLGPSAPGLGRLSL
jgi:hypothetical protein